jgi:TetR/AcrR family transcriptional regulator
MSESSWTRARSSEQIEQRVKAILDAAGRVFHKEPYENVTLQMIAKEAGFTRSNLYRYFATREEIFLELFVSDIDAWARQAASVFTKKISIAAFAKKWTEVLCQQRRLLELSPLLSLSLEKNTSEEVYRKTKLALIGRMQTVIPALRKAIPSLSLEQWYDFLLTHQALLAGAWPMAQYSEMQQKVLQELALPQMQIDFTAFYRKAILFYLSGMAKA